MTSTPGGFDSEKDANKWLAPEIQCAASTDVCVLINGQPEATQAIARLIHCRSTRASGPFVVLDCRAEPTLTERLSQALESGVTGAAGTVLIQEVGEMNAAEQELLADRLVKLRLSPKTRGPRVIASNSSNLWDRVEAGTFSDRLFFRLNTIRVAADRTAADQSDRDRYVSAEA
jgi:DNA-binding NtrC family response regulator